jgi:hypothetical protein
MNNCKVFIIIFFLILGTIVYKSYSKNQTIEGLNTFNGRMAIDDQYFYDKLFDDVYYYPNEYESNYERGEEIGKLIKTGWVRCKEECKHGHCVEYGPTGRSYCFPY